MTSVRYNEGRCSRVCCTTPRAWCDGKYGVTSELGAVNRVVSDRELAGGVVRASGGARLHGLDHLGVRARYTTTAARRCKRQTRPKQAPD